MPYTQYRRLSVQAAASNSGTWGAGGATGDDLNTGCFALLDYMLGGVSTFSLTNSNVSLSYTVGGGGDVTNCMWRFTGVLTGNIVASPAAGNATTYLTGLYAFENVTTGSFTITVTTGTGSVVLPQGRRGMLFFDGTNAPRIIAIVGSSTADPVPAGSKTIWYNTAAPSGWTAVALNDYAIKIVTTGSGGVLSGSVGYNALFTRTTTDAHTLTVSEMPSHAHDYRINSGSDGLDNLNTANFIARRSATGIAYARTAGDANNNAGGGDSHRHDIDMRVLTAAFTLASRD